MTTRATCLVSDDDNNQKLIDSTNLCYCRSSTPTSTSPKVPFVWILVYDSTRRRPFITWAVLIQSVLQSSAVILEKDDNALLPTSTDSESTFNTDTRRSSTTPVSSFLSTITSANAIQEFLLSAW
jgi:hypothetical protein